MGEEDKERVRQRFGLREWSENTTIHLVRDAYEDASAARTAFLFLCVLGSLTVAGWQILVLTGDFLRGPHYSTNIFSERRSASRFPNVTFCNFNRVNGTRAEELGLDSNALTHLFSSVPNRHDFGPQVAEYFTEGEGVRWEAGMRRSWERFYAQSPVRGTRELFRELAFSCRQTFGVCRWSHRLFDCCAHVQPVFNQYGLCYVLTPPHDSADTLYPTQALAGSSYGLKVMLRRNGRQAASSVGNNFIDGGFQVMVTFDPLKPFPTRQIAVPPSQHAWISYENSVARSVKPSFEIFDKPCTTRKLELLASDYTVDSCSTECWFTFIRDACGCVVLAETKSTTYPFCNGTDWSDCIVKSFGDLFGAESRYSECRRGCEEPCFERITVDSTATYSAFPSDEIFRPLVQAFMSNRSLGLSSEARAEAFVKDIVGVSVYSEANSVMVHETRETTSLFAFIANIGGVLGLWLGASVLTLVQLCYYTAMAKLRCATSVAASAAKPKEPGRQGPGAKEGLANKASVNSNDLAYYVQH